jgi:hypothetical protein
LELSKAVLLNWVYLLGGNGMHRFMANEMQDLGTEMNKLLGRELTPLIMALSA